MKNFEYWPKENFELFKFWRKNSRWQQNDAQKPKSLICAGLTAKNLRIKKILYGICLFYR
jgi:hypothetical protein